MKSPRPLIALARPNQWLKNGFVFVGLFFAHEWTNAELATAVVVLFAAFCLVSSAVYVFNDVMDRDADRVHPGKRTRPVAAGLVSPSGAVMYSVVLAAAGLALAAWVSTPALAMALAYVATNVCYSLGLKHVAVLDVFLIAAGFMLRLLAGTAGVGIAPSRWLLLCGLMVTLFLGFAKRRAELASLKEGRLLDEPGPVQTANARSGAANAVSQRRALTAYSLELLDGMIAVTAAGTVIGYAFYTIDERTIAMHGTDQLIYTVPAVMYGIARYLWMLYRRGGGADPSAELMRDPQLVVALAGWLGLTWWFIA
jgi:4-hydroxybenzoate polyprenyltransferase